MPAHILVFYAVQLIVAAYALVRGGAPERLVALMLLAAAIATSLTPFQLDRSYHHTVNTAVFWIDVALFVGLVAVAARADRFWPIWIAALQLLALGTHGARAYDPLIWAMAYAQVSGRIAYVMMLLLATGTYRFRVRLTQARRTGHDPVAELPA